MGLLSVGGSKECANVTETALSQVRVGRLEGERSKKGG